VRYESISRRHFLQGLGCSLALPLLPSLASRASAAPFDAPKYFIAIGTPHGCVPIEDWAPVEMPLNEVQLYSGDPSQGFDHRMHWGALPQLIQPNVHAYNPSGTPELSRVLGSFLNPYLDKLTLINGLDIPFYIAHHRGGNLGNYHAMDNNGGNLGSLHLPSMPTIDRVIARSPSFYPAGDPFTARSINFSSHGMQISFDGPVGSVDRLPQTGSGSTPSARGIFDALFGGGGSVPASPSDPRLSLIDRVLEDYNRVMTTPSGEGSRISNSDRNRLDEFVTGLRDVERKVQNLGVTCEEQQPPSSGISFDYGEDRHSVLAGDWDVYLDVVVAALRCGRSRVATMGTNNMADDYGGSWHQDIPHRGRPDIAVDYIVRSHRFAAENIYARLLEKLDVSIDGVNDTTYLDNALVVWNHEAGQETHNAESFPTLVAGGAGGFLQTGLYVDYRNLANDGAIDPGRTDLAHASRPGVPYNRWLYTALRAMGIPDAEYKVGPLAQMEGYADPYVENRSRFGHTRYSSAVLNDRGQMLHDIVA
jgi:hypothetical protein